MFKIRAGSPNGGEDLWKMLCLEDRTTQSMQGGASPTTHKL